MRVVIITNNYNPHVSELSPAFIKAGCETTFIETAPLESFRNEVGFAQERPADVIQSYRDFSKAKKVVDSADLILYGNGDKALVHDALKRGVYFFRWSEHLDRGESFLALHKLHLHFTERYFSQKGYLLCNSSHSEHDFTSAGLYRGKCLYWGYYPKGNKEVDVAKKNIDTSNPIRLLWGGRMLPLKHVEKCLEAADLLFEQSIPFFFEIVGDGECYATLASHLATKPYHDHVILSRSKPQSYLLARMIESDIYLFTSDKGEGWGAVVNEALSSQCAVLSCRAAGATDFLIQDGVNGLSYASDEEFKAKLLRLVKDRAYAQKLAVEGRRFICEDWTADQAVSHLLQVVDHLQSHTPIPEFLIGHGAGTFIRNQWYK